MLGCLLWQEEPGSAFTTLCVNNVYIISAILSALLPQLPNPFPSPLPIPSGLQEEVGRARRRPGAVLNGMWRLHWGQGMLANRLTTEWWNVQMAPRTLQPEGRANPGREETQVTKSYSYSCPFCVCHLYSSPQAALSEQQQEIQDEQDGFETSPSCGSRPNPLPHGQVKTAQSQATRARVTMARDRRPREGEGVIKGQW